LTGALATTSLFAEAPTIPFACELDRCPRCGAALNVLKSRVRKVATMHIGHFLAHETVLFCPSCSDRPSFRSRELSELVPEGCNFGYDVMVFAGRSLFEHLRTVGQTVCELAKRNVRISESEVRELAARFVIGLAAAHAEAAPALRRRLGMNGGYVLHLDSTCQKGSAHLMTGIDELSGMVLLNAGMPTENGEATAGFLSDLLERYGEPVAVCCDMSAAILNALGRTMAEVPVFICHFHFLRDLGKDLMAEDYALVRRRLARHGPKAELKRLAREFRDPAHERCKQLETLIEHIENGTEPTDELVASVPADVVLAALVVSALEGQNRGDGCGFPFDRPHLAFFRQLQSVLPAVSALRRCAALDAPTRKLYDRAIKAMQPVCEDAQLAEAAERLEHAAAVFDELRVAMRIAEPQSGKGLNDDGRQVDMQTIEARVERFRTALIADPQRSALPGIGAMLAQLDKYWHRLFADPVTVETPDGQRTVQPQRTNNILERFFRSLNRACRKRSGNRLTATVLDNMLPDVPLVANLDNPDYVELLLDGCQDLAQRLAKVDRRTVTASLTQARKPPSGVSRKTRRLLRKRSIPLEIALCILRKTA
jgi:hypothetical protein